MYKSNFYQNENLYVQTSKLKYSRSSIFKVSFSAKSLTIRKYQETKTLCKIRIRIFILLIFSHNYPLGQKNYDPAITVYQLSRSEQPFHCLPFIRWHAPTVYSPCQSSHGPAIYPLDKSSQVRTAIYPPFTSRFRAAMVSSHLPTQ